MFKFINIPNELTGGTELISDYITLQDEIHITAEQGDKNLIKKDGKECFISFTEKAYFFRALGIISERCNEESFSVEEKKFIKHVGIQVDFSRNGALNFNAIKRFMSYMALMGMDKLYLYIEDMFKLPERKYFGYMRGGYTKDELKTIDDIGFNYGIEVIPSIQVLGHHWQYMQWDEAADIRDTAAEILVDNDKTYEFIESMITNVMESFRTKTIFLGMDETHTLGLGNFLKVNGYEPAKDIFLRHLKRVFKIADKLGLRGITSSDMFFNHASKRHYYYDEEAVITEEVKNMIPENAVICYWHYGEGYGCDDYMMKKHRELGREFIFYGGSWTWSGHLPETEYAIECTALAMEACKKYDVNEAIITIWGDDGNECNHFYGLLTAQLAAEYAYGNEENFKDRFEAITGAFAEAFVEMTAYQNINDGSREYENFKIRFKGKANFWQDVLLGQLDYNLALEPMSAHYGEKAEYFKPLSENEGKWQNDYTFIYNIFKCLEYKCYVSERLVNAYKENNKCLLSELKSVFEEKLLPSVCVTHRLHKDIWFRDYRPFGWEVIEKRYAALEARIKTAVERLEAYLSGNIECIEELEAERLPYSYTPFRRYRNIATTTYEN